jgi:hypothetical protein
MKKTMLLLTALAALACRQDTSAPVESHAVHAPARADVRLPAELEDQLDELRAATKGYRRFDGETPGTWSAPVPGCFTNQPVGDMGYHFADMSRMDGTVSRLEPEILVYEPLGNGQLQLVAVEYAVPFAAWTQQDPPSLYGQSFHRNDQFGLWVLHVWHEKPNPAGIFMDWNRTVRCR